jgi:hypothetical protein
MSENVTKFTEQEMQSIGQLQARYQQKIFELGQLELAKLELDQEQTNWQNSRNQVLEDWKKIQSDENDMLQQLSQKYGDGVLSLKDGTFKPTSQK